MNGPSVFLVWYDKRDKDDRLVGVQLDSIWTERDDAQKRIDQMIKGGFPWPMKTEWNLHTKFEEDEDDE